MQSCLLCRTEACLSQFPQPQGSPFISTEAVRVPLEKLSRKGTTNRDTPTVCEIGKFTGITRQMCTASPKTNVNHGKKHTTACTFSRRTANCWGEGTWRNLKAGISDHGAHTGFPTATLAHASPWLLTLRKDSHRAGGAVLGTPWEPCWISLSKRTVSDPKSNFRQECDIRGKKTCPFN